MTDTDEPDARYDWHDLTNRISLATQLLRSVAARLPELPTPNDDGDCICPGCRTEDWYLIEGGYENRQWLTYRTDEGWRAHYESSESFSVEGDGAEIVMCGYCGEVFRRPTDIEYR